MECRLGCLFGPLQLTMPHRVVSKHSIEISPPLSLLPSFPLSVWHEQRSLHGFFSNDPCTATDGRGDMKTVAYEAERVNFGRRPQNRQQRYTGLAVFRSIPRRKGISFVRSLTYLCCQRSVRSLDHRHRDRPRTTHRDLRPSQQNDESYQCGGESNLAFSSILRSTFLSLFC